MKEMIDEAIKAHAAWKFKLTSALDAPDQLPDAKVVVLDNQCPVGKWIYGDGKKLEGIAEFQDVKEKHAAFHKAAGRVVELIRSKQVEKAKTEIDAGVFSGASKDVINALMRLKSKV